MHNAPLALEDFSFATSAGAVGGILGTHSGHSNLQAPAPFAEHRIRLRAIESSEGTLLGRTYDSKGRVSKIAYPDEQAVAYTWDDADRLREAGLEGGKRITFGYDEGAPACAEHGRQAPGSRLTAVSCAFQRSFARYTSGYERYATSPIGIIARKSNFIK